MQHILDVQLPDQNPKGAPGGDYQQISSSPDMFGGITARAEQTFGQGVEKAGITGIDIATQQAQQDARTHADELHSWQSDRVSDAQEKFLQLRGRAPLDALPDFKKQIDQIRQDAASQAGNPYTQRLVESEGRRLTDAAYAQSSRHAATERNTWDTSTAVDAAASSGSRATIAAATTPGVASINSNPAVVLELAKSDDKARQAAQNKGLDGDIEVQRNRGKNVAEIIKDTVADGSYSGFDRAKEFFHSQYDRIDPGSRATIEQSLKRMAASQDGQRFIDNATGRGPALPPGYVQRTFQIESGGNPNAVTGSNKGLGQFSKELERRYGINDSNRTDPAVQARALSLENQEHHDALARALGHEPTPADYYLAHQQGIGGAVAHLSQPNLPAWQNMYGTVEGREKGQGWAKQAIWGNMTPEMKAQFPGGVDTVTSSDFARMWAQRFYQQPIQAAGIVPGTGAQVPGSGSQMPGGTTPAAFTGIDRLQGATQFATQNKGEVINNILNDPYLRDRPQAMNAAITYANKVFESQTANYADMERQLHVQAQQTKMISDEGENNYLKQIYAPALNAKPLNVQEIVLNDSLSREAKDRLIKLVGHSEEHDAKTYGPGFIHALQMVHAPPGTEGRITDPQQLYSRLGPDGDLTFAGAEKLRGEISLKKTPEGEAESAMKKTMLDFVKVQLTAADPVLRIKDSHGEEQFLKFQAYFWPAYDKGRAEGKTPAQMLDPDSPDYLGKTIGQFKRSQAQLLHDLTADNPEMKRPEEPGKAPPFDLNNVSSLEDLKQAVNDGNITPKQARDYGISKQWLGQKTLPTAPVSQ